uniref:Olfactory receptor n=1 Tax=Gopherus evgoodei TaxID=1825980 RepID=A0A8C5F1D1_9SAUR
MQTNQTAVSEFVLLGLSHLLVLQHPLFVLFLLLYVTSLLGNGAIIAVMLAEPRLHTPMYFFLGNLSCLDIFYCTVTVPKMLVEIQTISFAGCGTQMYFFILFGITECCLLSVMAYDRYVAICHPLKYTLVMSQRVCSQMAAGSWTIGTLVAFCQTASIFTLPFCGSNTISHFFCDILPVLRLATTDTRKNEAAVAIVTVVFIFIPFLLILLSYILILSAILRMPSAAGQRKAFSTCSSHLIVVSLFYGTVTFIYVRPKSVYSLGSDRLLSLLYTVVTPMFNPIVYCLRNKEVRRALKKSIVRQTSFLICCG